VNARSALFDIYGDHLLSREEQAPVAAFVKLVAALRISAPAVRTAVSRMARQGWLVPIQLPGGAGYRLTPRAVGRLRAAADRIYRQDAPPWDGQWHVVVVERVADRAGRERLRSARSAIWVMPAWTALPGLAHARRPNSMSCSPPGCQGVGYRRPCQRLPAMARAGS
jgi:phenylacetic acid degradation operon negative regulatory protein